MSNDWNDWDGKSDRSFFTYYADEQTRDLYEREGRPAWMGHSETDLVVPSLSLSGEFRYEPNAVSICHPDFGYHVHDEQFYRELGALARGVKAIAEQLR